MKKYCNDIILYIILINKSKLDKTLILVRV
jgi:hypothetical protein